MSKRTPKVFVIEIILPPAIVGLFTAIEGGEKLKNVSIADASAASRFSSEIMKIAL